MGDRAARAAAARSPQPHEAVGRILGHGGRDDGVEIGWYARVHGRWAWGRLVQVRVHDRTAAGARERDRTGQQLVERAAEGVHIGAVIDGAAAQLLGGRVREGRRESAAFGGVMCGPGDAEIADQHAIRTVGVGGEQDVRRFQVAMQQPGPVNLVQALGRFADDAHRALDRQHLRPPPDQLRQIATVDVLHGDPQAALVLAAIVHRHQIRML